MIRQWKALKWGKYTNGTVEELSRNLEVNFRFFGFVRRVNSVAVHGGFLRRGASDYLLFSPFVKFLLLWYGEVGLYHLKMSQTFQAFDDFSRDVLDSFRVFGRKRSDNWGRRAFWAGWRNWRRAHKTRGTTFLNDNRCNRCLIIYGGHSPRDFTVVDNVELNIV